MSEVSMFRPLIARGKNEFRSDQVYSKASLDEYANVAYA